MDLEGAKSNWNGKQERNQKELNFLSSVLDFEYTEIDFQDYSKSSVFGFIEQWRGIPRIISVQLFIYDFIPAVFVNLLCSDRVELGERELAGVSPSPPPGLSSLTASMDRTTTEISIGLQLYIRVLFYLHCTVQRLLV